MIFNSSVAGASLSSPKTLADEAIGAVNFRINYSGTITTYARVFGELRDATDAGKLLFDANRSGLVRMDQIVHTLTNGIHKTRITFKPSNTQP